jgi:hypothetical protein
LNEANDIWAECKKIWGGYKSVEDVGKQISTGQKKYPAFNADNVELSDELYNKISKLHPEFNQSYPTVLRHMIQDQYYNSEAFKIYLMKLTEHPWTNDKERIDSYTDYYVLLYKKTHPRYDEGTIKWLREDYRRRVKDSHDKFMNTYKHIETQIEKEEKLYDQERRNELARRLRRMLEDGVLSLPEEPASNEKENVKDELDNIINGLIDIE